MTSTETGVSIGVYVDGDCQLRLWGLTPRERLVRMLRKWPQAGLAEPGEALPVGEVLVVRADYLLDERVLGGLLGAGPTLLRDPRDDTPIAARAPAGYWEGTPSLSAAGDLPSVYPQAWSARLQRHLLRVDRPWVARVRADNLRRLENALFDGAYKGVTDFITRGIWPLPARWATRLCVRAGLRPNHVTAASYALALLAGWWFWRGDYGWGLLAGWLMTFLDTVDGKLARVTLTSSTFGNLFDHALDLVHPPLWYLAWAMGLGAAWQLETSLPGLVWTIVIGYVAGRLCEGAFQLLAPFSLFVWRPFDSLNRLVTARRNPNLLLLTFAWAAGRPDIGLLLVALWTVVSTLVLAVRVAWAVVVRLRGEALASWLDQIDLRADGRRPVVRLFAPSSRLADMERGT